MQPSLTAIIFEEDGWQIAQCLEINLASQGNTQEEAFRNLQEAFLLHREKPEATNKPAAYAESIEEALSIHPNGLIRKWDSADEKETRKHKF